MNVYDSARMADVLAPYGYLPAAGPEAADLVILNTCHIREKAAEKVFSDLGRLKQHKHARKAQGKDTLIAVAGCVAQAEGAEILRRAPQVDLVFGPQSFHKLPDLIARRSKDRGGRGLLDTEFPIESKFDRLPEENSAQGPSAFLAVQEGCDKFCTFCVVPYTRGTEYSRTVEDIAAEALRLVALGASEITLLGQNVNAYHGRAADGEVWGLGRLIRRLAEIEGLERIRYTTSHPRDMDNELIAAHRDQAELMPFLHLPVQSGSDRILAAMNRRHTADDYRRIVERLRAHRDDLALSSDFIVGYPGETDQDFAATLRLVTDVGYAQAYSFKYSARPGTPAAAAEGQVSEAVKSERLSMLQQLLNEQQLGFNRSMEGHCLAVLVERPGKRPGQMVGRSPYMQAVHFSAPETAVGSIRPVEIVAGLDHSLRGRMAEPRTGGRERRPDHRATVELAALCEDITA